MADNNGLEFQDKKIDQLTHEINKSAKKNLGQSLQEAVESSGALPQEDIKKPETVLPNQESPEPEPADLEKKSKNELYAVVKPLRTYERDIAESIRKTDASLVSINLAEQKRNEEKGISKGVVVEKTEKYAQKSIVLIISLVLLVAGIGLGAILWIIYKEEPVVVQHVPVSLITTDSRTELEVSGKTPALLATEIEAEKSKSIESDKLSRLILLDSIAGIKSHASPELFFKVFGQSAPSSLHRALGKEWLIGFHNIGTNEPFAFFSVDSFDNAFDGMLRWEKDMAQNLGTVFVKPGTIIPEVTAISGTGFEDVVIRSKDVRVLKDSIGNDVVLYSFLDTKNLVITTNEKTFKEILNRFFASQIVR